MIETPPARRGRWRTLSARLKELSRKGASQAATQVEITGEVVVKRYQTSEDAQHALQRLEWLRARVDGLGRTPRVLDIVGRELTFERVWGPTLWELQRQSFDGSTEAAVRVHRAIIDAGRLLGRLHSGPPPIEGSGTLNPIFEEEVRWALDDQGETAREDLVGSHTDFAPINMILDVDGVLVVLDPEPNRYVTQQGSVFSRYVDLGVWCSALTMRAPLRHVRSLRRPESARIFADSLAAYGAEAGVDVDPGLVHADALAVTSAYLRAMGCPRHLARSTVRLLAPRPETTKGEAL